MLWKGLEVERCEGGGVSGRCEGGRGVGTAQKMSMEGHCIDDIYLFDK